jgi:hypothetical protein
MQSRRGLILPRNIGDRILLFALSLTLWLLTGLPIIGTLFFGWPMPSTISGWAIYELAWIVFSLTSLSIVWSVARPPAIEGMLQRTAIRALLVFGILHLVVMVAFILVFLFG